jgi:hypothetical protein
MHRKLRSAGVRYAKYKTETENLKSPNAKPVSSSRHNMGVCIALTKNPGSKLSPAAGQPNEDDSWREVQTASTRIYPLKPPKKLGELTPPPFTTPKINNRQPIAVYEKERKVSVLFCTSAEWRTLRQLNGVGSEPHSAEEKETRRVPLREIT